PIATVELTPIQPEEVTFLPVAISNINETVANTEEDEEEITENAAFLRNLEVSTLNIFPNPTTGIFDIQFELPQRGETAVFIYNPAGQRVYFNTLGEFSGTFSDRIDIANGVRGIYFLEVRQGRQSLTRKVVLQ
ncbi:MAG: T9SS type A sorting domain-containing protein, partial [Mameliella sp.]|nr:T9SS type A sorting domain-containing protein [Phaeodactylibacter sp.]